MAEYVLYVGYDRTDPTRSRFCRGSRRAIELVDAMGKQESVTVQSVDALRESMPTLPAWLRGTPTLVSRETRQAMGGQAAIDHLEALSRPVEEEEAQAEHGMDGMVASSEKMHLGFESNFEPLVTEEDLSKYDDSRKVTDADLQALLERRKATVPS